MKKENNISEEELHLMITDINEDLIGDCILEYFEAPSLTAKESDISSVRIKYSHSFDYLNEEITHQIMQLIARKLCKKSTKYQKLFTQIFIGENASHDGFDTPYDVLSGRIGSKVMSLYMHVFS